MCTTLQNVTQTVIKTTVGVQKSIGTCIFMMKVGYSILKELHSLKPGTIDYSYRNFHGISGHVKIAIIKLRLLVKLAHVLIVGKI